MASGGVLAAALLAGCALQRHEAATATPAAAQAAVQQRSPDDPALRPLLARQGIDVRQWPLPAWDATALRALALAVHPRVQAARADLAQALAGRDADRAAARSPWLQAVDLNLEHHSADGVSGRPWSLGIALDLGLSDAVLGVSRRQAREAGADALADEAAAQAAAAVWQVHRGVREAQQAWWAAQRRAELASAIERARREEAAAWQKRLELGAADGREAAQARQRAAEAAHEARAAEARRDAGRQSLATALGFTAAQAAAMNLRSDEEPALAMEASPAWHDAALLDRLDVRAGVARYAAADATLRLELARQLPELVLKPGWAWDQGDRRWSLGIGLTLPPVGGNRAAIAQASARRDAEAARFAVQQQQALGELDAAQTAAAAARAELRRSRALAEDASGLAQRVQRRLSGGSADRLEVLEARLAMLEAQRRLIDAQAATAAAQGALEDAVQRPLDRLAGARPDWLAGGRP